MSCPNCGAPLADGRCSQCGALVAVAAAGDANVDALVRQVEPGLVDAVFAMPLASTRPQSAGAGASWWVCVALKPLRERKVLARGLSEDEAVRLARALASRLGGGP